MVRGFRCGSSWDFSWVGGVSRVSRGLDGGHTPRRPCCSAWRVAGVCSTWLTRLVHLGVLGPQVQQESTPTYMGGGGVKVTACIGLHHICVTSPETDMQGMGKLTFDGKNLAMTVRKWMQEKDILVTFTNYLTGNGVPQCLIAIRHLTKIWIFG